MAEMDRQVKAHHEQFEFENSEPEYQSPAEEEALGIYKRFGIRFLKDGTMMRLTKFQVMRCIMDVNERIVTFDDEIKG